jgi:hypothetical protein
MGVNLNFFRNPGFQEPDWFDEGPLVTAKSNVKYEYTYFSASVLINGMIVNKIDTIATAVQQGHDTSQIDGYRQGVELTQMKHFDAGLVKIHAGEPGHVLRKNNFGEDKNFFPDPRYGDLDLFNPVRFLEAQEHISYLDKEILTFPIVTGDSDQLESFNTNGVIEPLAIRAPAAFYSMDIPFESHSIKGSFMGGSEDQSRASCQIVGIDDFDPESRIVEYLDDVDMLGTMGVSTGFFRYDKVYLKPFKDERYPRNVASSSRGSDMDAALSLMSGSTDNYVSSKQRSQATGWDYDTAAAVGTDSIAFGGMTY